ncbi:hypothetical protein HMPREF7545_0488 [Selenomonas noxia ATCC 43541]|nr:hypothetical protein HMPREF7545_0488 [Selenomonas noxia ATCC 43541]
MYHNFLDYIVPMMILQEIMPGNFLALHHKTPYNKGKIPER